MTGCVYWPESGKDGNLNFVGFNHCISILRKAAGDLVSPSANGARCRLYCNIPWHHDPASLKRDGLPLVAYTMFEATKLPNHWRDFLNRHCAAAIVPTLHVRDCFRLSGVTIPLKVATLGVDPDEFGYIEPQPHEGYNFLWQGHNYDPQGRKGAGFAEQAFRELRQEGRIGHDATLRLKYRPHQHFNVEMDHLPMGDNVFHICGTLIPERMRQLYETTDCCINTSHGEGFGFIPLEQMAMGRPVILTDWSFGFAERAYCVPVRYDLKPSPVHWCHKHFSWGRWGYDWTWGALIHERMIPKRMSKPANGEMEYGVDLKPVPSKRTLRKTMIRALATIQQKTGFYWNPMKSKRHTVLFEHPGYDAWIDLEDLKTKMEWCYRMPELYRTTGKGAAEYVKRQWGLDRVRKEFTNAITELTQEGVI